MIRAAMAQVLRHGVATFQLLLAVIAHLDEPKATIASTTAANDETVPALQFIMAGVGRVDLALPRL